jgi:hypothetical protein
MLRSRRLEKVLVAPIAELTAEHMRRLVEERVDVRSSTSTDAVEQPHRSASPP